MASWSHFATGEPDLAALAERVMRRYGIAYLATVRAGGAPRLHPICPVVVAGKLCAGLIPNTPKQRDLDRDERFALHTLPGPGDAEFAIAGRARKLTPDEILELSADAGDRVEISLDTAFYELCPERIDCTVYDAGQGHLPTPARTKWTAPA